MHTSPSSSSLPLVVVLSVLSAATSSNQVFTPTKQFQYKDSQVFVYDNIFPKSLLNYFAQYFKSDPRLGGLEWRFVYPDKYEGRTEKPHTGNLHWQAPISPSKFIKGRLWARIKKLYKSLPEELHRNERHLPYLVHGTMMNRGDFSTAFSAAANSTNKIFMRIFLNSQEKIGKHAYSDQAFYDEDDEIITSVFPKFGRIVVWMGDIQTLFRPPNMGCTFREYSLFLKLSTDIDLFKKSEMEFQDFQSLLKSGREAPFPFTNNTDLIPDDFDMSKHLVHTFSDRQGRSITVYDDVFPKHVTDTMRKFFINKGFGTQQFDTSKEESKDNTDNVLNFKPHSGDSDNTPFNKALVKMAALMTNESGWHPYDVACNLIQHAHHTRIHLDCVNEEVEYTFLMYLNPHWTENDYGETAFFQLNKKQDKLEKSFFNSKIKMPGKEEYELISAVIPKFGRIAVFRNLLPHSARPPAPSFRGARFTFPIKASRTKQLARAKVLREALEGFENESKEFRMLGKGDYEPFLSDKKQLWVEENLRRFSHFKERQLREGQLQFDKWLFPAAVPASPKMRDEL